MIRFPEIRSHLTLVLAACGMAVALVSVPTSQSSARVVQFQGDMFERLSESPTSPAVLRDRYRAAPKVYFEILTAPSDDPDRSGVPLSYVICTGTGLRSNDVPAATNGAAPVEYVVFPVEDKAAETEVQ